MKLFTLNMEIWASQDFTHLSHAKSYYSILFVALKLS